MYKNTFLESKDNLGEKNNNNVRKKKKENQDNCYKKDTVSTTRMVTNVKRNDTLLAEAK